MALNKWILLLAAVMAITATEVSYAQFGALGGAAKNKAAEVLTNKVMEQLEKKFTELVAKEPISDVAKANIVAGLSEMSRPVVKQFIDGATSGKLPNPAELTQTVLNDILPRVPELVAAAGTEGGGATSVLAARPQIPAPVSGDGVVIYNKHSYVRFDKSMTWTEAKAYCESLGGHLVTITSQEEQEAVYLLIKDGKKNFYWLGGYREGKNWQYVTAENFAYNNWISGKPDNADNQKDKLIMSRISTSSGGKPGQWDDSTNNGDANNMGYIFEFDNAVQPVAPAPTQTAQKTTKQSAKTQPAASAAKKTDGSWDDFSIKLRDNWYFLTDRRLFNGRKIARDETYILKITYTASHDLENDLLIGLIDRSRAANTWRPLTWGGDIEPAKIPASRAGEEVSATITLKAIANATGLSLDANMLSFWTDSKKKKTLTLNITDFVFYREGDTPNVPVQPTAVFAGNGHKYEIIATKRTWSQARKDCEKRGGYLATITSKEEQEFIIDLLSKNGKKKPEYWLGGYREGNKAEENWQWVTGEDFTYTNWGIGQPDNYQKKENKLQLWGSPQWNDTSEDSKLGYICEWD